MAKNPASAVIDQLRRTVLLREGVGLTDGQLLGRFIERREEAAFAVLVNRHGPMVWGVCRRVLGNHHDAEDAFQAAFLVLARKAASVAPREMLANWLHGVAHQTALQARRTIARRRARERRVAARSEPAVTEPDRPDGLLPLLDQELTRLPAPYRAVVVLCDLEGKTRREAARQLHLPEGTVGSRLARARSLLARRLARHGVVSGGALAALLSQERVSARVPAAVAASTVKAAGAGAAGRAAAGTIPVRVAALTEGVLRTMLVTKLRIATALVFALVLLGGAGLVASHAQDGKNGPAAKAAGDEDDKLKETLLDLDKQLWDASTKGDPGVAKKLLAEDFLSIWAVDDRTDRAASLELVKRYRYSDREVRDVEVRRVGRDAAVLTYVASYKVSVDNAEPQPRPERRISAVWGKKDGRWLLVFAQATSAGGD